MHRWHAPRLVRSARHWVAVDTGWGKSPGRARLYIRVQGVAEEARCQRAWHQRAKLIGLYVQQCWVFRSVLATLGLAICPVVSCLLWGLYKITTANFK